MPPLKFLKGHYGKLPNFPTGTRINSETVQRGNCRLKASCCGQLSWRNATLKARPEEKLAAKRTHKDNISDFTFKT
jgi:hypothetical protein